MVPNEAQSEYLPGIHNLYRRNARWKSTTIREEETDDLFRCRQITTPGVQGERTIKTRVYSSNGQEVDRQELSNEENLGSCNANRQSRSS